MSVIIIIPARMASTRLPNKPLVDIGGSPMIVRVMEKAKASGLGPVYVAAGDEVIVKAVESAGGTAVLTDPDLPSGSDRILAALKKIESEKKDTSSQEEDIILNLQGDMPDFDSRALDRVVGILKENPAFDIATLASPITSREEGENPNHVKLVAGDFSEHGSARVLYFSRAIIPWGTGVVYHHIGVYAYRRKALEIFCNLGESSLEKRERLEQLRGLEAGLCYGVALWETSPKGIDTREDLIEVRKAFL